MKEKKTEKHKTVHSKHSMLKQSANKLNSQRSPYFKCMDYKDFDYTYYYYYLLTIYIMLKSDNNH